MYDITYTKKYTHEGYNNFVKQSLERLTAHFGNYGGGYIPRQTKKIDYELI